MNGIIVVNQSIGHNQYKIDRFVPEFKKHDINVDVYVNDGTLAEIKNGNIVINLPKADFVLYLDKDIYLARMLEKAGYRLFNKADFIKLCDDKVLTYIRCANEGIRMIETIAGPLVYVDELEPRHYDFLDKVIDKLGLPLVVKKVYGSLGEGVYIAKNKENLKAIYKDIYRNPLLFQKYISTSKGRSIRVLIIDHKIVGAFERYNPSDFRSNFGDTASSREIKNDEKIFNFAMNIVQKLDISYAGIDLLYDEGNEPILCEINSNAFFEEFEKITGIDVAKLYVDMVIKEVNNEQK
ncbi:MAG: RimK family alpha-L-glutamate ligase [Bacilli bacterium]|nr:RimK family alpha-L-glutamate ligase [Bacilli bacterium]